MARCITNLATPGREAYLKGQVRLHESLMSIGHKDGWLPYTGKYPPGCPSHQESPYAFKYYAMKEAFKRDYDLVLWLDSSMVVLQSLEPIWKVIKEEGFICFDNPGCIEATWTTKRCLDLIGCSVEEAKTFSQVCGGCVGYNRRHEKAKALFDRMFQLGEQREAFLGGSGENHEGYRDHRHDQSCLSYLHRKFGFKRQPMDWLRYDWDGRGIDDSVIIEIRGIA